ncbi:MAG: hypothetical protein ACRBCL_15470 [Maritimibacter sp.]
MSDLKLILISVGIAVLDFAFGFGALIITSDFGIPFAPLAWILFMLATLFWIIRHGWRTRKDRTPLAHVVAFVIAFLGASLSLVFIGSILAAGV